MNDPLHILETIQTIEAPILLYDKIQKKIKRRQTANSTYVISALAVILVLTWANYSVISKQNSQNEFSTLITNLSADNHLYHD